MLSNELLVDAIKSGATNEEIYELVRSIYGEAMKKTYYSLLKRDKYYQSLLSFHNIFIINSYFNLYFHKGHHIALYLYFPLFLKQILQFF